MLMLFATDYIIVSIHIYNCRYKILSHSFQFIFTTQFAQNDKFDISKTVHKIRKIMYGTNESMKI